MANEKQLWITIFDQGIHGLKVGRFSLQDFDIEVIEPEIVDRLDRNRVDILETFLVTKSMLELADILKPLRIILWRSRGITKGIKNAWANGSFKAM